MPANVVVARHLESGGDDRSLTETLLDATVSEAFHAENVMLAGGFAHTYTLAPGESSHDFPIFGDASDTDPAHHSPGQFIEGDTVTNIKVNIAVDDPLIKAMRLPWVDQRLGKFDLAAPTVRECTRIVAEKLDKRAFRVLANAARTAAVSGVHSGGNVVERTGTTGLTNAYPVSTTGADNFRKDASDLARLMDEDHIPRSGRVLFIGPEIWQTLTYGAEKYLSRDYTAPENGNIAERTLGMFEGFRLIMTTHLPSTNITTDLPKYNGDYRYDGATGQPAALAMYTGEGRGPVGMVTGDGIASTIWFDENRETWLVKVRVLNGMGVLEPWTAGEIRITN